MGLLRGSTITGWGVALPEAELTNAVLADRLNVTEEWIESRTGIRSRRIAAEGETSASLSIEAGAMALANARVPPATVDAVIVATSTPDHQIPAVAPMVQSALGTQGWAYDLGAGCSGFLFAIAQADAMVRSGTASTVLVCGSDVLSTVTDERDPKTSILFGDGGGAAVVELHEDPQLGPFVAHSDGSDPSLLCIPPASGYLTMNGREVFKRAVDGMSRSVQEVLAAGGVAIDDVALVVAHQANGRILSAVGARLGLPADRVATNIDRVGNTSAASIPLAMHAAMSEDRLHPGDRVVLTAFGAGFVWGAGLMTWGIQVDAPASREADERQGVIVRV